MALIESFPWPEHTLKLNNDEEKARYLRIKKILDRLGEYNPAKVGVLLALTDTETPNPYSHLSSKGYAFDKGASTRHLADYANARVGSGVDRETVRDYVLRPLIEVGLVDRATVASVADIKNDPDAPTYIRGVHTRSKSPNNGYVAASRLRDLLSEPEDRWEKSLEEWLQEDHSRVIKDVQEKAKALVKEGSHTRLIKGAVKILSNTLLKDYNLVFIDDGDGDRIQPEWLEKLKTCGIELGLNTSFPDAILVNNEPFESWNGQIWFIEAVTSDGEVDKKKYEDLQRIASKANLKVAGMTTAYPTWRVLGARQGRMKNLAFGSNFWVAEDGGRLFGVNSLVEEEA